MPKVTIEFDLCEDAHDLQMALNGEKFLGLLWDLDQELRQKLKYGSDLDETTLEWVREWIRERVDLDEYA